MTDENDEVASEPTPEPIAPPRAVTARPETSTAVVWVPYVVVRPWDHGTLYTCSICGNYPDFPSREEAQKHVDAHSTTTA